MLELVARDPYSGRELRLGVMASLRDLEVLGSAGMYYAETYVNAERPESQVKRRRERAGRVGASLWNQAVDRCGIEEAG